MEINIAAAHEAVAAVVPERECLVFRDRRLSWADVTDRTRRLASVLAGAGLGAHGRPADVEPWQSVHDHVALYLHNGNEYLEGMLGAYKARCAPFNVNYRYVADELRYVLADASTAAIIYHATFAPLLAHVLPHLDGIRLLLQVDDGSGNDLLPGALDYEATLASAQPELPTDVVEAWSGDDLYVCYTGGTTGRPKGVLWRQADFVVAALGTGRRDGSDHRSLDELADRAQTAALRALPAPPLMHGAAHWNALSTWLAGGTVVIQSHPERFDPDDVLDTAEREATTSLLIVGDAFGRPLLDAVHRRGRELPALRHLLTGGAILSPGVKAGLIEALPGITIVDVLGSTESGRQGIHQIGRQHRDGNADGFAPSATSVVLSADRTRRLPPGDPELGWLAQTGRVPLGYLGDEAKTTATFPVIDGVRHSVAGDRARLHADGSIELLGRDSATINTGGEKVFAEEVETALKVHPAVYDAIVVGRPSERWGQEVVAVVQLRPGTDPTDDDLRESCATGLARYKLPRAFIRAEQVVRSPSGKADYAWAASTAAAATAAAPKPD